MKLIKSVEEYESKKIIHIAICQKEMGKEVIFITFNNFLFQVSLKCINKISHKYIGI